MQFAKAVEGCLWRWHPAPESILSDCRGAALFRADSGTTLQKLAVQFSVNEPRISATILDASKAEYFPQRVGRLTEAVDKNCLTAVQGDSIAS